MPYDKSDYFTRKSIDNVLFTAEKIWNNIFGLLPFTNCHSNDAKFGVDLGDLKYSKDVFLRLASQSPNFEERTHLLVNYLAKCNPDLKEVLGRMDLETKMLFYERLSEDNQFGWCFEKYPELELANPHMQPGLSGLHVADSVTREKRNNKIVSVPLGAIIVFLLRQSLPESGPNSAGNLFSKAPPQDPSRPPLMDSLGFGLSGAAASYAGQALLYGTHESFEEYEKQKAKEQAKLTSRLLQDNVQKVVSEHDDAESILLPRNGEKGAIKCINVEKGNSPSVETSETLRKITNGQTGCTSVCGTQSDLAVKECLKNSRTPEFSIRDNEQCEALGPYKSEDALKSHYVSEARKGVYDHETTWRRDQKRDPLFNGQCVEPADSKFNPWSGSSKNKIKDQGGYKTFASNGANYNKGCKLVEFPNPYLVEEHGKISFDQLKNLKCEDTFETELFGKQSYNPNQQIISSEELNLMLHQLRNSISNKGCPDPE